MSVTASDQLKEDELTQSTAEGIRGVKTREVLDARQTGKKISRTKMMTKAAFLTAAGVVLLMAILFAASALLNFEGSFTIRAGKCQVDNKAISLSETWGFANPTVQLSGIPIDDMDNITYDWLPLDELDKHDGSYNGENYIAYSFYIKNSGIEPLDYTAALHVTECTLRVDKAVRVMAYRNGEPTIYAVARDDGTAEPFPEGVVNFESLSTVFSEVREGLPVSGIDKWTFVVWLEGEDPECINDVRGGTMKLELNLDIVSDEENVSESQAG